MGSSIRLPNPLMGERMALLGGAVGVTAFGVTLADLGQIATIFAGFMGGIASCAAAAYYIYKMVKGKTD